MRKLWHSMTKRSRLLAFPYIIWSIAFIIVPLLIIIYYGFTEEGSLSLSHIGAIAQPVNLNALMLSLLYSLISTALCLIIAYPLSYILSEIGQGSSSFLALIFILPMWMNSLLRTIAWQNLLEKNGVINLILSALHLPPIQIINTPAAIVLGMVYDFLPFMVLPVYNSLLKIDRNLINAARDLGADGFQTFWRITWPLSLPGVISGITMVFVPSLTTFVISDILGGGKILLIGNIIEQLFTQDNDWNAGAGLSIVLMIFILISMILTEKYDSSAEEENT